MIQELFSYLFTPCGKAARRLGLLNESVNIAARHRRCSKFWRPHLENCRRFIAQAARSCQGRDTVLVLGSGHLLDIPLAELSSLFRHVVLADVVHPLGARLKARRRQNVRLVEWDATGLFADLSELALGRNAPLPAPKAPAFPGPRPDLVVSANLLSQLPIRPLDSLAQACPGVAEDLLADLAQGMIAAHLRWLSENAGRVCLITDTVKQVTGDEGLREEKDLLLGTPLPEPDERWTWDLAPRPELHRDADVRHLVSAYGDFKGL